MAEALTALAGLATIVQMAIAAGMKAKSHKHNVQALVRRLKLIPPLIEEVRASRTPLTEAQLNVFENLEHAMQRAKELLTKCSENSKLYMIFRGESIVQKFQDVGLDLDRCLSALPLVQLSVSDDTREKIEEVSVALREAKFKVDSVDQNLSLKIAEALKEQRETQRANEELLRSLATQLDLTTVQASRAEEKGLLRDRDEARAEKERGEEAYINQIIHLLDTLELADSSPTRGSPKSVLAASPQPPDEFRCPVSLDLMADPVILDSGHTFERAYIKKWLDDGHRTCPISRKPLTTLKLIPNQTLKGMIISWCERNHVPLPKVPVLQMEAEKVEPEEAPSGLEGFKGLRFNTDFSGSSAEWEAYESEERGSKKRRGLSKFEEELSRFSGHKSGLAEMCGKPPRASKADALMRGMEAGQQRLMLYNVETESGGSGPMTGGSGPMTGGSGPMTGSSGPMTGSSGPMTGGSGPKTGGNGPIGDGLRFNGGAQPSEAGLPPQNNSGQFSDGFSALGDLYNSGSLRLGDPDAYSNFDIRDIMYDSPLHMDGMLAPEGGPLGALDTENVISIDNGPLDFREKDVGEASTSASGSHEEPKFKLSWARRNSPEKCSFLNEMAADLEPSTSYRSSRLGSGSTPSGWGIEDNRIEGAPQLMEALQESLAVQQKAHALQEVVKKADVHSGPQDRYREKRALPADFQLDSFPEPSYRHREKEHLRPLARSSGVNGGSRHRPSASQDLRGRGAVLSRRTNLSQPLHYSWEIDGLETSPPLEMPKSLESSKPVPGPGRLLNGERPVAGGLGSSRRASEPGRQERRLEGANGHRRVVSLPPEPAGRSPLSRSPRSPPMDTILDEFLMNAQAQGGVRGAQGSEHRVVGPQRAVRTNSAAKGQPVEKAKLYLTNTEEVMGLLEALESDDIVVKRDAAEKLRALGKNSNANRATIAAAGAIPILLGFIDSPDAKLQEHAITAILNLSIHDVNKTALTVAGAIPALVEVLANPWTSSGAKESAAATLFSLSVMDDCKVTIGDAGAIPHLVDLLRNGSARGRKDAVTALFNLSIFSGNKVRIIKAKAVPLLVALVRDTSVREKCVAVLANLSTMKDGRLKIAEAGGIPVLVDQVDVGTPRSKENAAATLLQLGINSSRYTAAMIQAGAISHLLALSQNGTPRAIEKALALIRHFREQRKTELTRPNQPDQGVGLM